MKKWLCIKLSIILVTVLALQGCSSVMDDSDRVIYSEAVSPIRDQDVFLYESIYETEEGKKYGIGSYDPISGETVEIFKEEMLERVGIADIASTEHSILYAAYQEANSSGNGQVLYLIDTDGGRHTMLGNTAYKYSLYTGYNAVIVNDKDTSEYYVFSDNTHTMASVDIDFGNERIRNTESNGYSFCFFQESNGDIGVSTIRDAKMRPVLNESLDCGYVPFDGNIMIVGRDKASGLFFYQVGDRNRVEMVELNKRKGGALRFSEMDFCAEENRVLGRVTELGQGAFADGEWSNLSIAQKWIKKEYFIQLSVDEDENAILYETKDNNERIVGYSDNKLYLYKKDKVDVLKLDSRTRTTVLDGLSESHNLAFSWCNGCLIVFDVDTRKVIGQCN